MSFECQGMRNEVQIHRNLSVPFQNISFSLQARQYLHNNTEAHVTPLKPTLTCYYRNHQLL